MEPNDTPRHLFAAYVDFTKSHICRKCGKRFVWGKTQKDRTAPFDPETLINHFATCNPDGEPRGPDGAEQGAKQGAKRTPGVKLNRRAQDAVRAFRDEMQRMVDDPKSGITGMSMSAGGRTVEIAKREPKEGAE